MKRITQVFITTITIVSLTFGCTTTHEQSGALTGALVGAAVGSTVGSGRGNALAIWLGAVVGASIGTTIGKYMDEQDRLRTSNILETKRTHSSTTWINPDTQHKYTVTPTRTYHRAAGPCREFTLDAKIGGKTEEIYGVACRQADGSWKVTK
ncbi:MAG: hypothetical protein GY763_11445 [Gammaproteobacteria bacterium]|nr:hypothetical protein [Gammaproteobacteria bacterium]